MIGMGQMLGIYIKLARKVTVVSVCEMVICKNEESQAVVIAVCDKLLADAGCVQ